MIDLEWNRKSLAEKLDWLKQSIDDLVSKANHNISVQQERLRDLTVRLSALEKAMTKPPPAPRTGASKLAGKRRRSSR